MHPSFFNPDQEIKIFSIATVTKDHLTKLRNTKTKKYIFVSPFLKFVSSYVNDLKHPYSRLLASKSIFRHIHPFFQKADHTVLLLGFFPKISVRQRACYLVALD